MSPPGSSVIDLLPYLAAGLAALATGLPTGRWVIGGDVDVGLRLAGVTGRWGEPARRREGVPRHGGEQHEAEHDRDDHTHAHAAGGAVALDHPSATWIDVYLSHCEGLFLLRAGN